MAVPPDFTAGQVLTAAQMNAVGLWLIKTESVGTAVSTVVVSSAFSADYTHYKVIYDGGVGSTAQYLLITLGSTATGYYYGVHGTTFNNTTATAAGNNTTSWIAGYSTTVSNSMNCDIYNPQAADETMYETRFNGAVAGITGATYYAGGLLNNTTAYTAFTVATSGGTITGGKIFVYGYRD